MAKKVLIKNEIYYVIPRELLEALLKSRKEENKHDAGKAGNGGSGREKAGNNS